MKKLIILGAGGFGRELFSWARMISKNDRDWDIAGFLDDNPRALDGLDYEVPILGSIKSYVPRNDEVFAVAIGTPATKAAIIDPLLRQNACFATIIHPSAIIATGTKIGKGCVICPFALLSCNSAIGNFVTINVYGSLGHDVRVGDFSTLSGHVDLTGRTKIGRNVFLGSHATILPGVTIGNFANIGAGAVVVKNVPAKTTVFGNPARNLM